MSTAAVQHRLQLGLAARRAGQPAEAEANMVAAVSGARAAGDPTLLSQALAGLGQAMRDIGRHRDAIANYTEALALARVQADPLQIAHIARHVGDILLEIGDLAPAERHLREALAIERDDTCTPQLELANTLLAVARLETLLNRNREARGLLGEARSIYQAQEITAGVTDCDDRLVALLS